MLPLSRPEEVVTLPLTFDAWGFSPSVPIFCKPLMRVQIFSSQKSACVSEIAWILVTLIIDASFLLSLKLWYNGTKQLPLDVHIQFMRHRKQKMGGRGWPPYDAKNVKKGRTPLFVIISTGIRPISVHSRSRCKPSTDPRSSTARGIPSGVRLFCERPWHLACLEKNCNSHCFRLLEL